MFEITDAGLDDESYCLFGFEGSICRCVPVRREKPRSEQGVAKSPAGSDVLRCSRPRGLFPGDDRFVGRSNPQQLVKVVCIDGLRTRNADLAAFRCHLDPLGGYVNPVGHPRVEIVQHKEVRITVQHPTIEVLNAGLVVPPAVYLIRLVKTRLLKVRRACLYLRANDYGSVESQLIARLDEQVGAKVVGEVDYRAPPDPLEVGADITDASTASLFRLRRLHRRSPNFSIENSLPTTEGVTSATCPRLFYGAGGFEPRRGTRARTSSTSVWCISNQVCWLE